MPGNEKIRFDPINGWMSVEWSDKRVALTRRELEIMDMLVKAMPNRISIERFASAIWGVRGLHVDEKAICVHISRLRKLLKPVGMLISVDYGYGYRLEIIEQDRSAA